MRFAVVTLAWLFGCGAVCTAAAEISDNYGASLEEAREAGRPLLVVLDTASKPGALFRTAGLTRGEDREKLLDSYELCHIDVGTEYGRRVAKAFHVSQLPHTAIIDRTASFILFQHAGPIATDRSIAALVMYRSGVRGRSGHGPWRRRSGGACFT